MHLDVLKLMLANIEYNIVSESCIWNFSPGLCSGREYKTRINSKEYKLYSATSLAYAAEDLDEIIYDCREGWSWIISV